MTDITQAPEKVWARANRLDGWRHVYVETVDSGSSEGVEYVRADLVPDTAEVHREALEESAELCEEAAELCDVVTMDHIGDLFRERADMIRALAQKDIT